MKNVDLIQVPELDNLNLGEFSPDTLSDFKSEQTLFAAAGLGLGAGGLGGAAVAFGAYNGTMLLATASTGTVISSLSGAAATNATLAWLGGGALSVGGGGIAAGTMVLGGLVAGPALAIFGHFVGSKGEEALNQARSNMEVARSIRDEASLMTQKLMAIGQVASLANHTYSNLTTHLRHAISDLQNVLAHEGESYQNISQQARQTVFRAVKYAQLVKAMFDTPILDEQGSLVTSTESQVTEFRNLIS